MHPFRTLTAAAAVAIGLQASAWAAPASPQEPSPDVVYHAPSWWISAMIEGKFDAVVSGLPDNDQRLKVWVAAFGYGFGSSCGLTQETRQVETLLKQQIAARSAMERPSAMGIQDGKLFAQINGCSNERATGVRRTVAALSTINVADANTNNRPDNFRPDNRRPDNYRPDNRQPDNRKADNYRPDNRQDRSGQNDRFDHQPMQAANQATVVNRSGTRIMVLRMSETWDQQWGIDRLGEDVLDNGAAVRLALAGSRTCHYDLQVTYADRQVEERRNVNLCQANQVVFDGSQARFSRRSADAQQPNMGR